ncbi:hypothetical protein KY284_032110 [Solanum tuberosum]|nr:hypothetical protein KY284_032110 [Solanum tuberosum]
MDKYTKIVTAKTCKAFGVNVNGFEHEILEMILRMEQKRKLQLQQQQEKQKDAKSSKGKGDGESEDSTQASRVERFLISTGWSDNFGAVNQLALPKVTSDHRPIVLESGDWSANPSYFKFENTWLQHDGFTEKVKEWWQSYNVNGTPDYILAQKLKHLKRDISKWQNEDSRGKISDFESQTGNSEVGQSRGGLVETKVQMFVVERG